MRNNTVDMDILIDHLEHRLKYLIQRFARLNSDHTALHQGQINLLKDRSSMKTEREKTANQIEALVARLKMIEAEL